MKIIDVITDKDFELEFKWMIEPKIRKASRGIVIRESDGKIAVQYKKKKNQYKLVGGGIEGEENSETAFVREVLEETGCEVEIVKQLGIIEEYRSETNLKQTSYVYIGKVLKDTKILNLTEKEKAEGAELLWEIPEKALSLIVDNVDKLIQSEYENIYSSKFVALRDIKILEYYLSNK